MFEIIFLSILIIYFFQIVLLIIGLNKKFIKIDENKYPKISVIVAARNEENNILNCMESLNKLEYENDKIEIIISNDHSEDKTAKIIEEYIKDKPKFKTIIPELGNGNLKGKANALDKAIKIANGEIILSTDADCIVPPLWAKTISSYFTEDVAMVSGYTNQNRETIFNGMQGVDFIFLLSIAGGAMNLNKPLSCIGNNLSFRKSVYFEVGGYESVKFSVTEDFALQLAIKKLGKYKIIHPVDHNSLVTSKPCKNIKSIFRQKKRWAVGGLDSEISGFFILSIGWLIHFSILLIPFFYSKSILILFFFKLLIDYYFLKPIHDKLLLKLNVKDFIFFELYFNLYVFLIPLIILTNKKVVWKGREFE